LPNGRVFPYSLTIKEYIPILDPKSFHAVALSYPEADLFVVSHDIDKSFIRKTGKLNIRFVGLPEIIRRLQAESGLAL
jgi:hypothetical protein